MDTKELLKRIEDGDNNVFDQITLSDLSHLIDQPLVDDFSVIQTVILQLLDHQSLKTDDMPDASYTHIINKSKELEIKSGSLLLIHEYLYNELKSFNHQSNQVVHEIKNYLNTVPNQTLAEADVYFFLARFYINQKEEYLIEETLYRAIEIYDHYAETKHAKVLERLGQSYRYLGEYYELIADYSLAVSSYEHAIIFFSYLRSHVNETEEKNDEYIYQYVMVYYQYLKIKQKLTTFDLSELKNFIDLLRKCVKELKGYDFYLASLLYDYAEQVEKDDPDEAIQLYEESLDIRQQKSRTIKQEDLAMTGFTYTKIARLYQLVKEDQKALYYYDHARDTFQMKAKSDPNYQIEVGRTAYYQALIYQKNKMYEQTEYHYFIAQDAYESASKFHSRYTYDFQMNQYHLAMFYMEREDYYNASIYFVEAANFFTSYYDKDFNRYAHYAGMSLFYASKMSILAKRDEMVDAYVQAGFLILKKLYQVKADKYIYHIAELYLIYGKYLYTHKQYSAAIENLKSAVEVYEQLYQRYKKQADDLDESYQLLIACYKTLEDEEGQMSIQFDYLSFLEICSFKVKAYEQRHQRQLKQILSVLLIEQVDEPVHDLIAKMKVDKKNKSLDYAILMCYSLTKNNLGQAIKNFEMFKMTLLNDEYLDQHEVKIIGLLNRFYAHNECKKTMDNKLANKIVTMMQKVRKSTVLPSEKEILIESALCLNQYFMATNQPDKIKEIESFHQY
jgi:tetratricopeptide (TPR) repeat protein